MKTKLLATTLAGVLLAWPALAADTGTGTTGTTTAANSATTDGCDPQVQQVLQKAAETGAAREDTIYQTTVSNPTKVSDISCLDDILNQDMTPWWNLPSLDDIWGQIKNRACQITRESISKATGGYGNGGSLSIPGVQLPGGVYIPGASGGVNPTTGGGILNGDKLPTLTQPQTYNPSTSAPKTPDRSFLKGLY